MSSIYGSMIIQVVGVFEYFLAKVISKENSSFYVKWLNTIIIAFIPISMITSYISELIFKVVKELLYVSKTDGKQRTEYKTIDFAELLRVQIADVTDLLSEKEISLSVDIPDKILCDADPAQMERAIQNVLVNAIRYSPNGEAIYISLSNDKNTVSCKVENTGVHIPEEMIPHLFEAFYRADTSRNRNTGGTGLGLYIVRKIMELHHAKYGIQNTSKGVVFWLEMQQERGAINSI